MSNKNERRYFAFPVQLSIDQEAWLRELGCGNRSEGVRRLIEDYMRRQARRRHEPLDSTRERSPQS